MICDKCKAQNSDDAFFCIECGAPMNNKVNLNKENTNPFTEGSPYAQNPGTQAQVQQNMGNSPYNSQPYRQQPMPDYRQQQAPGQQPMANYTMMPNYNSNSSDEMTTLGWLARFSINFIPCVGPLIYVIMLILWSCGIGNKKSLKTFARAQLIFITVVAVMLAIIVKNFCDSIVLP